MQRKPSFRTVARSVSGWLPKLLIVCIDPPGWGHVAEWLRSGLQRRCLMSKIV
jgi:hypothetical protein